MSTETFPRAGFQRERLSVADEVLRDLRSKILSGEVTKGSKLPSERELAAFYDVSGPTVREVIRALKAMSLVEVRHGSGTYVVADSATLLSEAFSAVVQLDEIDLASVLSLTDVVYEQAVGLAVDAASDAEVGELRRRAERFAQPIAGADEFEVALESFLTHLVDISHSRLLQAMSRFLVQAHLTLARSAALTSPPMWDRIAGRLIPERLAIVESLERRDRAAATDAVKAYTSHGRNLVGEHANWPAPVAQRG